MKLDVPEIDKFTSRKEWEEEAWRRILQYLTSIRATEKLTQILNILLTPAEKTKIVRRGAAIQRLQNGKSYKEIGEELWLSPQTISSISKSLRDKKYTSYWTRSKSIPKKQTRIVGSGLKFKRRVRTKYGTMSIRPL